MQYDPYEPGISEDEAARRIVHTTMAMIPPNYASLVMRSISSLGDWMLILLGSWLLCLLLRIPLNLLNTYSQHVVVPTYTGFPAGDLYQSGFIIVPTVSNVVTLVVGWLYFAVQESSIGQATLGKKIFRLQVTRLDGATRLTFARASARYRRKLFSALPLMLGFVMVGVTAKKQGLHDFLAQTLVVMTRIQL